MFADPQIVTYAAASKSLPAIGGDDDSREYKLNDGGVVYDLILQHQFAKRNRVTAKLRRDSFSADPLVPANSIPASVSCSVTIDFPNVGVTAAEAQSLANALIGWATSANVLRMINGEV